jgi:hypothetical protein
MTNGPIQASYVETGFRHRVWLILGILAYVGCYQWMYIHYLYQTFAYFGYDLNPPGTAYLTLAWLLSVSPGLWMPMHLTRPSQLAYWVLYLAVIIPSMFVPLYAGLNSSREVGMLMVTLFAGFAIVGTGYLFPLIHLRPAQISRKAFWRAVGCVSFGLTLWMVIVFRNHLHIVSFEDVYDLRDAATDVGEGSQVNYAFMLLTGAINPFLMGCGLYYKRRWLFLAGAIGQLLVYSVAGTKGSILSVLFISCFYFLFKLIRYAFALKVAFSALVLLGVACLSYAFANYDPNPLHAILLFVILMRTLSINGLVTAQYYDFFQHNPLTFFSHIKGVNWFVPYPYKYSLGQEIGLAFAGTTDLDATAHFWATDGIGGFGLPGILLVSFFCAFVFLLLDSAAKRHDPRFAALVITYAAYNISNISIFTSLFSGGLALIILTLYLMPPENTRNFVTAKDRKAHHIAAVSPITQ